MRISAEQDYFIIPKYITILFLCVIFINTQGQGMGEWEFNSKNLPQYKYTGPLIFNKMADGSIPDDPWFILGNYRITVFAHASGNYELVTGERIWAMGNHLKGINGCNRAKLTVGDSTTVLTGLESEKAMLAEKTFGTGFARYRYKLNGVSCERVLSVLPSDSVNKGVPALLIKVTLINHGGKKQSVHYSESVAANYQDHRLKDYDKSNLPIVYIPYVRKQSKALTEIGFKVKVQDQHYLSRAKGQASKYDIYPPSVYLSGGDGIKINTEFGDHGYMNINGEFVKELKKGERAILYYVTGFNFGEMSDEPAYVMEKVVLQMNNDSEEIPYLTSWEKQLPNFNNEKNEVLRREMIWNAYVLEAMATFSSFYNATYIPQGTAYEYYAGNIAASRDHLQHSLPLAYYNPELAASIISYVMKKMTYSGEITIIENGYGMTTNGHKHTSDQQLFLFMAVSEYLRITNDYGFLTESLSYYPPESKSAGTVYEHIENAYRYFRDEIGTGLNGLVKLLNSDWNDQMYAEKPLRGSYYTASSHLNSAIGAVYLLELSNQIELARKSGLYLLPSSADLISSMRDFRNGLLTALQLDLENRTFSRRAWMKKNLPIGDSIMYLAPHGYLLQIPDLSTEQKTTLLYSCKKHLINDEVLGARQSAQPHNKIQKKGEGENAGFWYALNGPLIIGANQVDSSFAKEMLYNMSFHSYSINYPDYWIGHWTGPDTFNSSISDYPGLVNSTFNPLVQFPVFCGHAHAWPLYCYFRLNEKSPK